MEAVVGAVEAEIVMAAEDEPRQEVLQDAEVVQGVEVVRDVQEPAVLQVIDLCPEVAAGQWHHQDDEDLDLDQDQIKFSNKEKNLCFVFM